MPVQALQIEITGGGADRLERQRSWARGDLPLQGTPDLGKLPERLAIAALKEGAAIFVRIFKEESELELWMMKGGEFRLFATYPICQWSGVLGPKFYEGDNQSPEGFYIVGRRDLKWQTRHHRAFNIGFPNGFDKLHGRTGSNILVHGGCSTEGCFAMTNPVIDEIFKLANSAVASGQRDFHVHVFPFRMTAENLMRHSASPWLDFWINLKTGYDLFAESRLPPAVGVCKSRYVYDRLPEFGPAESERDCDVPVTSTSGAAAAGAGRTDASSAGAASIVTTGSLRATAGSTGSKLNPVEERRAVRRAVRSRSRGGSPSSDTPPESTPDASPPTQPMGTHLLPGKLPIQMLPSVASASTASHARTPTRAAAAAPTNCEIARASCRRWTAFQARHAVARAADEALATARPARSQIADARTPSRGGGEALTRRV